jgi:hypothetical protein
MLNISQPYRPARPVTDIAFTVFISIGINLTGLANSYCIANLNFMILPTWILLHHSMRDDSLHVMIASVGSVQQCSYAVGNARVRKPTGPKKPTFRHVCLILVKSYDVTVLGGAVEGGRKSRPPCLRRRRPTARLFEGQPLYEYKKSEIHLNTNDKLQKLNSEA